MKITTNKNLLLEGILTVQKAVSTKSSMQVLECILVNVYNNTMKLTGNNLEISIQYEIPVNMEIEGSILLNARMFGDIIRKLPDEPVTISKMENDKIDIECGNSYFSINSINPKTYPELPAINTECEYEIKQKNLKDMIRQTIFAASNDEKTKILTGALFEYKDNLLTIVAIDSFRMAIRRKKINELLDVNISNSENNIEDNENGSNFSIVIPAKVLNELSKILTNTNDIVKIMSAENQVVFETSNCRIITRILGGEYLNYKNFIPENYKTEIKVKKDDLLSSIERASVFSQEDRKYPINLKLTCEGLFIDCKTEHGIVNESLYPEIDGDELGISYNPKFFIEALKAIDDEEIKVKFTTTVGPSIIAPIEGNDYSYMILPVRS